MESNRYKSQRFPLVSFWYSCGVIAMSFSWNTSNPASSPALGVTQNMAFSATQNNPAPQGTTSQNLQPSSLFSSPIQSPWTGTQNQPSLQGNLKPPTFGSSGMTTTQSSLFSQPLGIFSSSTNASPTPTINTTQNTQTIKSIPFWQLPDAVKTEILEIEKFIRNERQKCLKLETQNNLQQLEETEARINKTVQHFQIAKNTWESLVVKVQACKNVIKNEMNSVETVYAVMESATRDDMTPIPRRSEEAVKKLFDKFFSYLKEMEENMNEYEQQTQTAMSVLQNVSKSMGWKGQAVEDVLKQEYEYFIFVASRLAYLREKFRQLKEKYLKLLQLRNPDATSPFEVSTSSGKPSYWNERYHTPMKNISVSAQQPNHSFLTTPISRYKPPLPMKGSPTSLGKMDEKSSFATPWTDYSRKRDVENSSFKTPLPQVTRFSVSSFLQ
ncbi:hypothetical protein Gasu2_32850 [Galdieria sulphuraria]|uniref:Nucleoporin p58/p45 n=1 Tax=Galdieria sulphuraria TaxID=130081 RepID=M2Y458_GALSU|nr:uncharacterized protein Gasu_20750 [Galdieria sulphuraria]EME30614.1 hypothetical protein Gasu_20750 [Galdieria sulphuraria]GJD09011.1 hypothetical protein Gasu2_32850 [Galdieria sulphuraria]|eukprot:XP_005707134.1 hypothetical protein Gasu_20750 [Galdieria sulphuraria]